MFAENSSETVLAHLGGLLAGVSTVPANFHLNADELAYILSDSGAAALFVGPETVTTGLAAAEQAGVPFVIGWRCPELAGPHAVGPVAGAGRDRRAADRPRLLAPTSCTRRVRPGARRASSSRRRCSPAAPASTEHVEALAKNAFAAFGTHLVVGPMYHTGPLSGVRLLAVGIPVVVLGRFDAEGVLQAIDTYGAETSVMVPTHFVRLLALPDEVRARYDVSSVKSSATPAPPVRST